VPAKGVGIVRMCAFIRIKCDIFTRAAYGRKR
jgi:hypothetical protein